MEAESRTYKAQENIATKDLEIHRADVEALSASKIDLTKKLDTLKRTLVEKEEDGKRARKRLEAVQADLQGKLSIILKEKDNQSSRASASEAQQRHAEQHILELQRNLTEAQSVAQRKENDLSSLQDQILVLQRQKDASSSETVKLRVHMESLSKQVQDVRIESSRASAARNTLEQELDKLRMVMQAQSSEDVKQKEMANLKEREMKDLRHQVSDLTLDLSNQSKLSTDELNKLRMEVF